MTPARCSSRLAIAILVEAATIWLLSRSACTGAHR